MPEGVVFDVVSAISKRLAGVGMSGDGVCVGKTDTAGFCVTDSCVRIQFEQRDTKAAASWPCDIKQEASAKALNHMAILVLIMNPSIFQ